MLKPKRTRLLRVDPEFEKLINRVRSTNFGKNRKVWPSRITLAIKRQYEKYPNLLRELEEADLK